MSVNERTLRERFAEAYEELSAVYAKRVRAARTGTRPYPSQELYDDLYTCAGNHGLFAIALWAYFRRLYGRTEEEKKPQEEHTLERENEDFQDP